MGYESHATSVVENGKSARNLERSATSCLPAYQAPIFSLTVWTGLIRWQLQRAGSE